MQQYLLFAIVGLGLGCVYAAVSMGIVITYRGTGIINFATGAMAMWGAFVYDELMRTGDLVLPLVVIKHRYSLGGSAAGVPFAAALVLAVLSCGLIGFLVHVAVFRPLRRAPILARVVASVGVLLAIQALVVVRFSSAARVVSPILPSEPVTLGGISFSRDRLWLTVAVVSVAVAAWAWFRYTRIGLAIRASTEDERAISLARYSPQMLAGATWVLSATVAGFLVILATPTVTLNSATLVLAIVPALAAAVIGRLTTIGVTVAAALGLGVFQSIVVYQSSSEWWPDWAITGLPYALPFGIIVIALFGLGHSLPARGSVSERRLPEVVRPKLRPGSVAVAVASAGALLVATQGSFRLGVITSVIMTVVMLSLVVLTGLVGQISLAQAAIAGAAGFALSKLGDGAGVPFPISTLTAALIATAFGLLVGIPALRIRGVQLAVVTLSGAVALEEFVFRNPSITATFGNPIGDPTLFGWNLGVREGRDLARLEFGFLVLAVAVVCAVAVSNLARSATGRRFLAVRSNERAGASVGIPIAATKMLAFGVASFLAGMGGALLGYSRGQLSADSFSVFIGLSFLALAYLCGITSVAGAIIAGLFAPLGIVYVLADRIAPLGQWYQFLAGVALVVTAIFFSEGIAGAYRVNSRKVAAFRAAHRARARTQAAYRARARTQAAHRARAKTRAAHRARAKTQAAQAPAAFATPEAPRRRRKPRPDSFDDAPVVLEVCDLTVRFGGLRALDAVSLRLREGEIVGLIGPNGAGKTTFVDAVGGFVPSKGEVRLDGRSLAHEPPHVRAQLGLTRTWQSLELFDDLTVAENLQVAAEDVSVRSMLADLALPGRLPPSAQVGEALGIVGITHYADAKPSNLPLGTQKLVGVARAIAPAPRVMLADEPAAGLSGAESVALGARLLDVAAEGVSVLLIDHDMGLVLDVCDYIYVLEFGRVIAQGSPGEIRADEAVVAAYLGSGAHT